MKKNIFRFNDVEEIVTKEFALECCEMSEKFSLFKRVLVGVFFSTILLLIGFISQYAITHFDSATNEYQHLVAPISIIFVYSSILFLTLAFSGIFYRKKNNLKLSLFSAKWLMIMCLSAYILSFILSQLFISVRILRYFYSIMFIVGILLIIFRTKKNVHEFLSSNKKEEDFLSKNWKIIRDGIGILFSITMIYSVFFSNDSALKQNFFLILMWFFPMIIIASGFFWTSIYKSYIKLFYLNYFSEEFRKKFDVDYKIWYGSKFKEKEL
ncbi:hypothetical protein [Enterococcus plantarum]|uniref:hypothetical protein n=1 Tax=Enterococcus plantarum TaxID=1077675 RepID=UPI001A9095F9|nr:hypothetical protein [Enterococcus plantarum]MBO0424113.1 hypothetical protein [Enterococcus plantarum]